MKPITFAPSAFAVLGGIAVAVAALPSFAAPPRCEAIPVEDLRRSCVERVERCEPLKTAAEREACYRTTSPAHLSDASVKPSAPLSLLTKDSPAVAPKIEAAKPVALAPAAPAPVEAPKPVVVTAAQAPAMPAPPAKIEPAKPSAVVSASVPPAATAKPIQIVGAPIPPAPAGKVETAGAETAKPITIAAAPAPQPKVEPAKPTAPAADPYKAAALTFYQALSRGDGVAANASVIPEKRNHGAYSVSAIRDFYGHMSRPLMVTSVDRVGEDTVRVGYNWTHASGKRCEGAADVVLTSDGLIRRIAALNGC